MSYLKDEILQGLADAVVEMDEEGAVDLAKKALENGISSEDAIMNGLSKGMEKVSELFETYEYFVSEVVVCADTMYAALDILRPKCDKYDNYKGSVVIGVVEGDTHDIGKNIVSTMLEGAGFKIYDLGRDVSLQKFADKALEVNADLILLSSLMTTTMHGMKEVIEDVKSKFTQNRPYVMVGGAPISKSFADAIGADGYSSNAPGAVKLAQSLMKQKCGEA